MREIKAFDGSLIIIIWASQASSCLDYPNLVLTVQLEYFVKGARFIKVFEWNSVIQMHGLQLFDLSFWISEGLLYLVRDIEINSTSIPAIVMQ